MILTRLRFFVAQACLAFLPALLVLLVAQDNADEAADLSVVFGVVGASFSIAYFGQRAFVTLRGHALLDVRQGLSFRVVLAVMAAAATLLITASMGLAWRVALFAAALKSSEAIIDLLVGIWIRHRSQRDASNRFLWVATARAVLIAAPLLLIGASRAIGSSIAIGYLLALGLGAFVLAHIDTRAIGRGGYRVGASQLLRYGWELRSFLASTAACSILSALPRVLLPQAASDSYTAAALSLSCVPIFALGFQALWLANLKRLSEDVRRHVASFVTEIALFLVLAASAYPLWKFVAAAAYGLATSAEQHAFTSALLAALAYFGAMTSANLFKATRAPVNEAVAYSLGSIVIAVAVVWGRVDIDVAMVAAAVAIAAYVVIGLSVLMRSNDLLHCVPGQLTPLAPSTATSPDRARMLSRAADSFVGPVPDDVRESADPADVVLAREKYLANSNSGLIGS